MNYLSLGKIIQIILSLIVTFFVLIQAKGMGLNAGVGNAFSAYRSRRGAEKAVFILTIVFSLLLVINSLLIFLLS